MRSWRSMGRKAVFFTLIGIVFTLPMQGPISDPVLSAAAQQSSETATRIKDLPKLKRDRAVERELAGEQAHSYRIKLRKGEFLRVAVEQRGADVTVSLIDPDGEKIVEVNSRKDSQETELVLAIAEVKGYHRLDVAAVKEAGDQSPTSPRGYSVKIEALRKASGSDRNLVAADAAMREADRLRAENKAESRQGAVEKYLVALPLWRALGEREREADALGALGGLSRNLNEFDRSLEYFNRALPLRRALNDRKREASALGNIAQTYEAMKRYKDALDYYNQALPLLRETKNQRSEAITLTNIGAIHLLTGENQQAIEQFQRAASAWSAIKDQKEEAGIHVRAGRTYEALNDKPKALESYGEAMKLYRAAGDRAGEASALLDLGVVNRDAGNNRQALEFLNQALPLWRELGRKGEEASTLNYLGLVYRTLGQKESAIEHYDQALALSRELKNQRLEATVLNNIASVHYSFGEKRKALESFNHVLPLRRAAGDRLGEASTLANIGVTHADLGENQQALDYYNQALPIWRELKRRGEEVIVLQNIGETYDRLGEKQRALDQYNQALELIRPLGARQIEGTILTNLATAYSSLGEKQKAVEYYLQSLEMHRATGNATLEADVMHLLGFLHYEIDEKQKALDYLSQALPLWQKLRDKRGEAITLTATAMVYRSLDERERSLDFANRALPLHREVGNRAGQSETLINTGLIHSASGDRQQAIGLFNQAAGLSREIGDPSLEAKARYETARAELDLGNFEESRRQIEETLRIVESLRTKVASQELRASYFATVQRYYDLYIDLLMRMHERQSDGGFDGEALQATERARARSLIEILSEANANIREGVDPQLLDRERALQQQLNGKADALARLFAAPFTQVQADSLKREIDELSAQYRQVRAEIRRASPRYAALTQPSPLTLKEIQQVLDDDTMLLEYSLGERRSFLWAVTKSGIESFALPPRAEIETAARKVYELLSKPNQAYRQTSAERRLKHVKSDKSDDQAAAIEAFYELSDMLIGPVASRLKNRRLVVVAEGALQYVPFAALPMPGTERRSDRGREGQRDGGTEGRRDGENAGRRDGGIRNRRKTPAPGPSVPPSLRPSVSPSLRPSVSNAPLIVNHEIISLPSASTLAVLRQETSGRAQAPKTLAVIADPVFEKDDERVRTVKIEASGQAAGRQETAPTVAEERLIKHLKEKSANQTGLMRIARLPFTRQEANEIASHARSEESMQALDFEASRATVMANDIGQYRFVHFATHGYLDSQQPELSALVLSLVNEKGEQQSGFLYAHEVYNLKLPAEVVVLSACETGLGKEIKGEGLVGLTRGFMYAGAPRVVVSLWNVNDRSTAELMAKFYRRMLAEKKRPAAALRAAQVEMWKQAQWQAPYYWAAFVLQGEWR